MDKQDQIVFLKDFDQLLNLTPHRNLLNFYGTCITSDWIYLIFEDINFTLKRKVIDARIPVSVDKTRISSISEEYLLKIMYDIAETMEYLSNNKVSDFVVFFLFIIIFSDKDSTLISCSVV